MTDSLSWIIEAISFKELIISKFDSSLSLLSLGKFFKSSVITSNDSPVWSLVFCKID